MTDRAAAAPLPDETPIVDLPLRSAVRNALRFGGVLALGDLRAMGDRELMALRNFGRRALADVRTLVPAPGGSMGAEVTIAGRAFTLGLVYAPLPRVYGHARRRLLSFIPGGPLPGGRVEVAVLPPGNRRVMAGEVWAAWAGEPVEDGSGKVGR